MAKAKKTSTKSSSSLTKVLLVGCGRMGYAMLSGWINANIKPENIRVIEPGNEAQKKIKNEYKIIALDKLAQLDSHFRPEVVVFAVKPQELPKLLPQYKSLNNGKVLFISIAAGIKLKTLEKALGTSAPVMRAMPNLPALIARAITAAVINANVMESHIKIAEKLFLSIGEIVGIAEEKMMDVITAISGSGPAYVFLFLESLINAAVKLGLSREDAEDFAKITLLGSSELAVLSDKSIEELRQEVTSPGGTTEAALKVLLGKGGMKDLMVKATAAAAKKSASLG